MRRPSNLPSLQPALRKSSESHQSVKVLETKVTQHESEI